MEVIYERCCGLDVHKKTVTACLMTSEGKEVRTFGTMTEELCKLVDWIIDHGCTHVAMESSGIYWKPIYNLLELSDVQAIVVNARHIKALPGRKTDVKDAEWIADLLRHGLLAGSYIPTREQRELREMVRYRRSLIEERTREVNRVHKVLEGANIKLSSVVSDIMGKSARSMLKGLIGLRSPEELSELALGRMKSKKDQLEKALSGLMGEHQRIMLKTQLDHIDYLDSQIAYLDQEIIERMLPFEQEIELLDTIPGVGIRAAQQIIAKIGIDMDRFPSAKHLASWAGMCPGNNESAGKRRSGRTTKGNRKLRSALVEAAHAASRTKNTYLSAKYGRIAARRGKKRAAVAIGHSILVSIYHMIKKKESYRELGADYFNQLRKDKVVKSSIKKLESLGYKVQLEEGAA